MNPACTATRRSRMINLPKMTTAVLTAFSLTAALALRAIAGSAQAQSGGDVQYALPLPGPGLCVGRQERARAF